MGKKTKNLGCAAGDASWGQRQWRVGALWFDESAREVRSADGTVALQPLLATLFMFLLRRPHKVVCKEELFRAVWTGRIVTESVLTRAIANLRAALDDDAHALIQAIHGLGYRLNADPLILNACTENPATPKGFRVGARCPGLELWIIVRPLVTDLDGHWWIASHIDGRTARVCSGDQATAVALRPEHDALVSHAQGAGALLPMLAWCPHLKPPMAAWDLGPPVPQAPQCLATVDFSLLALPQRIALATALCRAAAQLQASGLCSAGGLHPSHCMVHQDDGLWQVRFAAIGIKPRNQYGDYTPPELVPLCGDALELRRNTLCGDTYSVGYLVWQIVSGSLRARLLPGWEVTIPDKLLVIALAAATQLDARRRCSGIAQLLQALQQWNPAACELAVNSP